MADDPVNLQLGDFTLETVIGRGGMGEVYKATQRSTGMPAAVKFDLHAPTPEYRAAFFHEVRLVAGLDHPNCVQVLDAGLVEASDEVVAAGKMPEGAPWLAMELALGGALSRPSGPRTWDGLLHVLRALLEALAHAHARGVLHRDIKFGNLLLAGPRGDLVTSPVDVLGARVVLSDFGIGHLLEGQHASGLEGEHTAGTPQYMSPEQIQGFWRDMGPWTDLYQVGVLAWTMATQRYPFRAHRPMALLAKHLSQPPPEFQPALPVPDGFEAILRTLLEKKPADRFQYAAHVVEALDALPHPVGGFADLDEGDTEQPTISLHGVSALPTNTFGSTHRSTTPGTGLWGLRVLPLVGRSSEQERLQIALRRVVARRKSALVAVTGATGTGRTRLAQWLREWAHAEGLADAVVARHGNTEGPNQGLVAAVARALRVDGLSEADRRERLVDRLEEGPYTDALVRLVGGEALSVGAVDKTLAVTLRRMARQTPRIVVLEDVHEGDAARDTLRSVGAILADLDRRDAPLLFVITARTESLADNPALDAQLRTLLDARKVDPLVLDPLDPDAHRELVRSLLGLDGTLAETVEQQSAGNPGFAVDQVGHWVDQGWLVPGKRGLVLAEGASPEPPRDRLAVWRDRAERLTSRRPLADRTALQLAAILGHTFAVDTWQAACAAADCVPSAELVEALVRSRLGAGVDARMREIRFAHALLVEALREQARADEQFEALCAAAATAVEAANPDNPDHARLARLHLGAGRPDRALTALRWAVEAQLTRSDARSDGLLDRYRATEDALGLALDDPRRADRWLLESWMSRLRSRFDEAEARAREALTEAEVHDWTEVRFRALRELGQQAVARGDFEKALGYFHRAARRATDADRTIFAAHCVVQEGDALLFLGRHDDAREAFEEVVDAFEGTHAWRLSHEPPMGLANVAIRSGKPLEALPHLDVAQQRAERARLHGVLAQIANFRGEIARHTGDLPAATGLYAEAADRYRALEHNGAAWPALNVGLCLVLDGRSEEALAQMRQLLRKVGGMPVVAVCARYVAYAAAAGCADWDATDDLYESIRAFMDNSTLAEGDLAHCAHLAAQKAKLHGEPQTERQALRLQLEQLERLGRTEPQDAIRARLKALG